MLRRLKHVAHVFSAAADVGVVLTILDGIAADAGLAVHGVLPRHRTKCPQDIGEATLFAATVSDACRADIVREYKRHVGASALRQYADQRPPPAPFTLSQAMRALQPSGEERWIFDLLRDHKVRDGVYCVRQPWALLYYSDHVLKAAELSSEIRMALDAGAAMAFNRLQEITADNAAMALAPPVALSVRERTVLLHLSDGLKADQIADRLAVTEPSVRTFIRRAVRKLNAMNQLHAVSIAIRQRLI